MSYHPRLLQRAGYEFAAFVTTNSRYEKRRSSESCHTLGHISGHTSKCMHQTAWISAFILRKKQIIRYKKIASIIHHTNHYFLAPYFSGEIQNGPTNDNRLSLIRWWNVFLQALPSHPLAPPTSSIGTVTPSTRLMAPPTPSISATAIYSSITCTSSRVLPYLS